MGKRGLRHKKNFLVARQKKVTRNCEISIIKENRINKCNISISTLLFFFSIYSSGTQELHPHEANWRRRNAYYFFCHSNSKYIYSSYFPCIVHAQREPPDTRIIVFVFSFIFKEGRLNKYLKETSQRIF